MYNKIIKKVSIIGIIANLLLMVLKLFAGIFSKSSALIADSMHSLEDMLSSLLACIGAMISSKKSSNNYNFGLGKAEYIFSFLISIFMIFTSITLFINSIKGIVIKQVVNFSYILVLVCIVTIIIKLFLFVYVNIKYKQTHSILIKASKIDHRNDIYITIGTLIGLVFSYFGVTFIDSILAIVISIFIGINGVKLFIHSFEILMDKKMDSVEEEQIKDEILNDEDVLSIEKIISKPIGNQYIVIIILCFNNYNDLKRIHENIFRIKQRIKYKFTNIKEIYIETKKNKCIDF